MILLRLFKNNRMAAMAGIFILTLALFVISIIRAEEVTAFTGMPFYNLIFGAVHLSPILDRIIALVFIMLLGYMLIRLGARFVLLPIRSFMPALFFILFSAALSEAQQVSPALVGSVFYLFCFAILFDINDNPSKTFSVFSASVVLALGSMFYLKLIWFIPLIWISLATMRTVTTRELFYPVIAYILLGLFLFSWHWAVLDNGQVFVKLIAENIRFEGVFKAYHFSAYIYYGFFMLLVIIASIYMVNRFQARKTVIQNIYQVMFYMFVAGLLFFFFIARFDATSLVFISFPIAYILSNYFHRRKNKWIHELILWIMVGLLVFVQIMV